MLTGPSWRTALPPLTGVSTAAARLLDDNAQSLTRRQGMQVFGPARPEGALLLLISGTIRVQYCSETGAHIVLYRLHCGRGGQTEGACLLALTTPPQEGIAETDVQGVLIPRDVFEKLMALSKEFRACVFGSYTRCISDMVGAIEDMALRQLAGRGVWL